MDHCIYIVSHGNYPPVKKDFIVPSNIRLIQISKPSQSMYKEAIQQVLDSNCDIDTDLKTFYYVLQNGDIFQNKSYKYIIEPSNSTLDLILTFNKVEVDGIKLGLNYKSVLYTKETFIPSGENTIMLSELLTFISTNIPPNVIVDVYNLSCRAGEYVPPSNINVTKIYDNYYDHLSYDKKKREYQDISFDIMDELSRDINTMNVNTFPELIPGSLVLLRTTDLNKAKEFSRIQKLKFSLRKDKIPLKRKPNNMSSLEYER